MVTKGKVVSINYRLTNRKGQELERTKKDSPFRYLHGAGSVIRGLELGLSGLKVGEKIRITVSPNDAYGEVDERKRAQIDLASFPPGSVVNPGDMFRVTDDHGVTTDFEVERVEDGVVHVNANHPLAGETLQFDVEVVAIRDATSEEVQSGRIAS